MESTGEPTNRLEQEALLEHYVAQNDTEAATKLLYELIGNYAREKNFEKAEALHDRMYEVDPMALTEIVRARELIEAEKSETLDAEHLELWPELYYSLNTAEANALYYSMKPATFEAGDTIMAQGELKRRLYFILSGYIHALYKRGGTEHFFTTLSAGDLFGQASFFSLTVCTVTLKAQSRVKVNYLEKDVLKNWKTDVPALETKLADHCSKKDRIKKELEKENMERRADKRFALSGRLSFQLLDNSGKLMARKYKGHVADISAGGLSFLIKSNNVDSMRLLLGRQLRVGFEVSLKSGHVQKVSEIMTIIAIQPQVFDDFSIHVKFESPKNIQFIAEIDPEIPVQPE